MSALDDIRAGFEAAGLPTDLATTAVSIIEGKGYAVGEGDPVTPVAVLASLKSVKKSVEGIPGVYVVGIQADSGWLVSVEVHDRATGKISYSPWQVAGADFLTR